MLDVAAVKAALPYLTPAEMAELDALLDPRALLWVPQPGPQLEAYESPADVLFYGGAAGGGKTDLLLGLAMTQHQRSIIYRREGTQLLAIQDRMAALMGSRAGFNGHDNVWRLGNGRQVEFGACKDLGDEQKYQGRPHDLKAFDEITHFAESQFRFLAGWLRTTTPGQRCRIVCAGNPPTDAEGDWVKRYWAPWLDPMHPRPARGGELRWFAMLDGEEREVGPEPFEHRGETIYPLSRTFIPSRVRDNVFMVESGYEQILQALPEPLRSQMLKGDFAAGTQDDPWQVLPTAWVDAAMARWEPRPGRKGTMDSMGVDVARGGPDETVLSRRHGEWFDELLVYPGAATPDGPAAAGLVIAARRDAAPVHVDVIGLGASVYDHLKGSVQTLAVNASEKAHGTDASGKLRFLNRRAELAWRMREALDPARDSGLALPRDSVLRADLCAPRWKLSTQGIQVESKEDLRKRLGRSPDRGDAVLMALIATPRRDSRTAGTVFAKSDFRP